jgi:hypothetical protein
MIAAIAEILHDVAPRALSAKEIAELAVITDRLHTSSGNPASFISKAISTDIHRHGTGSRFLRVGYGKYIVKDATTIDASTANNDSLNQELLEKCRECGEIKKRLSFSKTGNKGSLRGICKTCRNVGARSWNTARRTSTKSRASRLLGSARARAKERGLPFDLDRDWILTRLDRGFCEATGLPFDLTTERGWNTPSLDQIAASHGYTKTNTRLVLFALNAACGHWGEVRLLSIISALLAHSYKTSLIQGVGNFSCAADLEDSGVVAQRVFLVKGNGL